MPRFFKRTLFTLALATVMGGSLVAGWAANRGTMVIFNANWCASCRELVPMAQEIARQNNLEVREINVDFQDAPKQARTYGLSIPSSELPQIFYADRGRATLLFSGQNYKFGQSANARATILQNLQRALPSGASGN